MSSILESSNMKDIPKMWLRKFATVMLAFESVKKDGHIGNDCAMNIADRIIKIGDLKGDSADRVITYYKVFAESFGNGTVWRKHWVDHMISVWSILKNPETREEWIKTARTSFGQFFQALDFNADGFITFDEYSIFWKAYDLDPQFARTQFDYMDTDNDEKINQEEFVEAFIEYVCNTDKEDSPNRFFGPLLTNL
ncbi:unnamed protein product [Owenia fusiformis]|uniref:EF-hand domain-containing protein n=1 Tax=Owenia fusiformis TaxID=6347 RepID=A0A8S4N346_OWEFU|nr:unnamed protein product [Owenia fusiformis]